MSAIDEIKERLQKYPHVRYEASETHIIIFPTSEMGFEVALYIDSDGQDAEYTVHYNGWHEHEFSKDEALESVAFGLSTSCRIREFSRSGEPYKWIQEYFAEGEWREGSTLATIPWKFWKRKEVKILSNNLLK